MRIYIPKHIKNIRIVKKMSDMLKEYGSNYYESPESSFDNYYYYLKSDPVKRFLYFCISASDIKEEESYEEVINYIAKMFYSVKGTTKVFEFMRRYLGLTFIGDIIYTVRLLRFTIESVTLTDIDENIFYQSLLDFLNALLYFGELDITIQLINLWLSNTLNNYTGAGEAVYLDHSAENKTIKVEVVEGEGDISGEGEYAFSTLCTLEAFPSRHFSFKSWNIDGNEVETNPTNFIVTEDKNIEVRFTEDSKYNITVIPSIENSGILSGSGSYYGGDLVKFKYIPDIGFTFGGWYIDNALISENNPFRYILPEITEDTNLEVTAEIEYINYNIVVNVNDPTLGNVNIETPSGTYHYGEECTLRAIPIGDFRFLGYYKDGILLSTDPIYTFIIDSDITFDAVFTSQAVITIESSSPRCRVYFSGEATIEISSEDSDKGSVEFYDPIENVRTIEINSEDDNKGSVEFFTESRYIVTVTPNLINTGIITGAGNYNGGSTVRLRYSPRPGFRLSGWYNGDTLLSTLESYDYVLPEVSGVNTLNITAVIEYIDYNIVVNVNDSTLGSVSIETSGGTYHYGEECTLRAIPNEYVRFLGYYRDDETLITLNSSYVFRIERNITINAVFSDEYTISISSEDSEKGSVEFQNN